MRLSTFIQEQMAAILEHWIGCPRSLPSAARFDEATLRDHAAGTLQAIAADLEHRQDAQYQDEKSRGKAPRASVVSEDHRAAVRDTMR